MTRPPSGPDAGWIEWHGGENPVPGEVIEWRNANGMESRFLSDDVSGFGKPLRSNPPIIAYRVVKEAEPPQPTRGGEVVVPVAWRGEADGIDECTVRSGTRDDWIRHGRKITPLYAAPSVSHGGGGMREDFSYIIHEAMRWAVQCAPDKNPPYWVDGGNSLAQDRARKATDAILAALTVQPDKGSRPQEAVVPTEADHTAVLDMKEPG